MSYDTLAAIAGAGLVAALLLAAVVFLRWRREEKPGPHNNWRKNTGTSKSFGWSENFPGGGTDCSSGGAN